MKRMMFAGDFNMNVLHYLRNLIPVINKVTKVGKLSDLADYFPIVITLKNDGR